MKKILFIIGTLFFMTLQSCNSIDETDTPSNEIFSQFSFWYFSQNEQTCTVFWKSNITKTNVYVSIDYDEGSELLLYGNISNENKITFTKTYKNITSIKIYSSQ